MNGSIFTKFLIIIFITIAIISSYVIKNQINSNQAKSLIMQIKKINIAIDNFTEKYHALPGDVDRTTEYGLSVIPTDGNNDNNIKDPTNNYFLAQGEIVNFWHHLTNAKMLNEKYDGLEDDMAKVGSTFPQSIIGNAGIIAFSDQGKTYLQIGYAYNSKIINTRNDVLTPLEAYLYDKKTDNENPNNGNVLVAGGSVLNFLRNSQCASGNYYRTDINKPLCQLRIEIK